MRRMRAFCKGSLIIEADAHHRGRSVHQILYEIQHDFKAVYRAGGAPHAFLNPDIR